MGQGYWEQGGSPLPCMCVCMRIWRTEEFDIPYGKSFSSWLPPHFRPIVGKTNNIVLKEYMASTTRSAYKVMVLWPVLAAIAVLYFAKVLNRTAMFMITAAFLVCDLTCVLLWCPLRLLIKARCCITKNFYSWSLFFMALLVWELYILMYSERFWEYSNETPECSNCTNKLCTQYCRKLT